MWYGNGTEKGVLMFEIWQCDPRYAFDGHGYHPELGFRRVWRDETRSPGPEEIFTEFQRVEEGVHMPPEGYEGRSLTCGDLINLDGRWLYCAPVGWEDVAPPVQGVRHG